MRKISIKGQMEVLKLFMEGEPYDAIVKRTGISKGSVVNIIAEFKKGKYPEFAEAQELWEVVREGAVLFRKHKMHPFEAVKAVYTARIMQELNIDPNMIPHWVTLCKRLDAGELDPEQIVRAAAKLISIEERTGKTYDEIIDEYRSKDTELAEIKQTLKTLTEKKNALEEQVKQASARYRIEQSKLAKTVNDRECLHRVGIEKIVRFSRLIEAGEKLGYRPEKIKEAEAFHRQLTDIGINPLQLKKFIKERGRLNTQLANMQREIEKRKRMVSHLRDEEMEISRWVKHMRELRMILRNRLVLMACSCCLRAIDVPIHSKRELTDAIRKRTFLTIACPFCGVPNYITPQDVLQAVGWMVLDR